LTAESNVLGAAAHRNLAAVKTGGPRLHGSMNGHGVQYYHRTCER
jgi:hypothetical protein